MRSVAAMIRAGVSLREAVSKSRKPKRDVAPVAIVEDEPEADSAAD
jgi:hypothetical protein